MIQTLNIKLEMQIEKSIPEETKQNAQKISLYFRISTKLLKFSFKFILINFLADIINRKILSIIH